MTKSLVELEALVDGELARMSAARRTSLGRLLVPPVLREIPWDYGRAGERHACWIVGRAPDGLVSLAYCDAGFGPAFPWGYLFEPDDGMGMDAQWHSGLEDAAIGAGCLSAPQGYVVPGPREPAPAFKGPGWKGPRR